ncbi:MAG TPA: pyruvate:ferredoxin (flavodoxin) oxidoreductase [Methylococcus sp.]|nr:pyruvate:ferredoxin (flavodoxin) oxidoreductase [Methylococcus sp.]
METTLEGNEAVAHIAYRLNEVCAIYPITPSSPMAELADQWAAEKRPNLWGDVPKVVEMQSEGGAAGVLHGALQSGALATTFTASQGLLLMIPNLYKIAGELTPTVIHVAARSLATQGLSIFCDHSDVAAVRPTGFAQLCSGSVQEAHDMAFLAQAASLQSRIPFLHFFDGFRTSHEVNKLTLIPDQHMRALIDPAWIRAHRQRALNPDRPFIRGTAQNPDVYFQSRETVNPFYARLPEILQDAFDRFARYTGRGYRLYEYYGHPEAELVAVLLGSAAKTMKQTVEFLRDRGEKVGMIQVRLCLPFSPPHFLTVLPPTVRAIAVLDRVKLPGSMGEPLYTDVVNSLMEHHESLASHGGLPKVIGGRYGLGSKEFTPAMAKAVLDELRKPEPKNHFTVGIEDDVTHSSLEYDESFQLEPDTVFRALFFGLGSDGTVGANKNSIKIIGESTPLHAQGYFVYDSKKSGSRTVSHLRFGPDPIESPYLIRSANFIGCHQFAFVEQLDLLQYAAPGATLLLNSPFGPEEAWDYLPRRMQEEILAKRISLYVIDASRVARDAGLDGRINIVMQTCFFALAGIVPREEAIAKIKESIRKTYGKKGEELIRQNFAAVDRALERLFRVISPDHPTGTRELPPPVPPEAPEFVQRVTAFMIQGKGDRLPVSALPADGTYPSGTSRWERRDLSTFVPVWEPEICVQCGNCSFACPHGVIRSKFYSASWLAQAPQSFRSAPINARGFPDTRYTLQVYVEYCTGCGICVEVCPAQSPTEPHRKAIHMEPKTPVLESERVNLRFFESLPVNDRSRVDFSSVRGTQFLEPLFEFPGACAGCGETPYLRLLSQLFGDRLLVANATGCSSIYGGNLPTTPWSANAEGQGPAWSNSLFEDNAEFGFGFRLSVDLLTQRACHLLETLRPRLPERLAEDLLHAPQNTESEIRAQRARIAELKGCLQSIGEEPARELLLLADHFVRRSVWLVGGDGWAYDIGSSGLDHVLASCQNVNVLVLDTEVYSNTGGQMSKATPLGAVAKFAAAGKPVAKKDLALQAIAYGNVYVARVAMGANPQQTLLAFREAEAYPGPSLILAYSHCIAHGFNLQYGMRQQDLAVACGHWPLMRYNPALRQADQNPFVLDSPRPRIPFKEYALRELRYRMLAHLDPAESTRLLDLAQQVVDQKWTTYEEMASWSGSQFHPDAGFRA